MPDVHVVIFPPALFLEGVFISRYWHRQTSQPVHSDFALHLFSCLRCCSPVICCCNSPTKAQSFQFLSELLCQPWLTMLSPQVLGQGHGAPLTSPFAHLGMKPCSFTHLLPSTSQCDKKPIWLIRYENPGSWKPIMRVDWLPNANSEIAVTRKGMWSQQDQSSV